uniref:Secreted protein n=1 Tax=Oryzias latipes TaxID=8090 RepID=A0A3P9JYJ9_ORYLA
MLVGRCEMPLWDFAIVCECLCGWALACSPPLPRPSLNPHAQTHSQKNAHIHRKRAFPQVDTNTQLHVHSHLQTYIQIHSPTHTPAIHFSIFLLNSLYS